MKARWLLLAGMLATTLLYWPGLTGPFLLDDFDNLRPLQLWLEGTVSWQSVLLENTSGTLGRPVSMASFLLQAWMGGTGTFAFKFGNLIVHLACGLLAWQVLRRVLVEDRRLARQAEMIATVVTVLWLLHPLHVSTVLYAVQRMAQLSTLFVLASVLTYLIARRQLAENRLRPAVINLFLLFPLLLLAGMFSKENAVVAPALCLVLELAYFRDRPRPRRTLPLFYGLFLAPPLLGMAALLVFKPARLLGGYLSRDFTLTERLLTQPRALLDYIGQLLLPRGPRMGLYTDDFAVSTGLLAPPSTLVAILVLVAVSVIAIRLRKRLPSLFAGWFFFLAAHGVESTFLPLELYFEHRNYLPSVGLLLAAVATIAYTAQAFRNRDDSQQTSGLLKLMACAFVAMFAFATFGRVLVWQDKVTLVEQGLKHHPTSLRANTELMTIAADAGKRDQVASLLAHLIASSDPRQRMNGYLIQAALACRFEQDADPQSLAKAIALAQPKVTFLESHGFDLLRRASARWGCGRVTGASIADGIVQVLDAAQLQPDTLKAKWLPRFYAAELYFLAGDMERALPQAKLAWQPNADPAIGALLVRIFHRSDMQSEAQATLTQLERKVKRRDIEGQEQLAALREMLGAKQKHLESL